MTEPATVQAPSLGARIGYLGTHAFVLAYCAVLLSAFAVQFGEGEYPCPLCILQRMAMILAVTGPVYIISRAWKGDIGLGDYAFGYGLAILASLAGMGMSARQVLLHITPGDPGYGSPVLGIHLYTWAFITFAIVIAYCGIMLVFAGQTVPKGFTGGWPSKLVVWLFFLIVAANLVSVFALEGFHWFLPDDPSKYELFN